MNPGALGANFENDKLSYCSNHLIALQVSEIEVLTGNSRTSPVWQTRGGEMGHDPWPSKIFSLFGDH